MSRRAFTLLEVLLAAMLTTLVGLAIAQVLFVTHRAQERVEQRSRRRALLNALERRLREDLRGLLPPGGLYAAGLVGEETPDATGTTEDLLGPEARQSARATPAGEEAPPVDGRDRLTLSVFPPALAFGDELPPGQGSAWSVVYYVDDDPQTEERGLVRAVTRLRDPVPGAEPEPVEELCSQVVGMSLNFFDGTDWAETWDSSASDTLPRAVEVRLALLEAGQVIEARLLVSPPTSRSGEVPEATQ